MRLGTAIPALPVRSVGSAVEYYLSRFGFTCPHQDAGFAVVVRDDAELYLWEAGDDGWRTRSLAELRDSPVCSGAETFIAGTASCRIQVDDVDELYAELAGAGVLHPVDEGRPVDTDHGTREFPTLDRDGNLLSFYRRS
jgi:hypothetical protein